MTGKQLSLLGGPFGVAAYQIQRSLRFNSADSAYLNRTLSAGNRKTWTWSGWVKRSAFDTFSTIFCGNGGTSDATFTEILFRSDQFQINGYNTVWRRSTAVYRDPSAWYHLVVAFDTTQATASNRVKLYVNGTQVTDFAISNDPTQNTDYGINAAVTHGIGSIVTGEYYNGYLTEVNFIDGQALTPSSFGETNADTGVWQPKQYTGTYGTNGFYLDFVEPTTVAGQLYKSSTLYTTKTDILANATAISGGASISSEYLYFVPNSNATTGTNVFTSNGSMDDPTRYFYRSGGSWVQTSGSYGTTEFTSMLYGTDSSNYRLSASRDFYLLSSSTGQAAATGTVPTLRTELIIEDQSGNNNNWVANNISTTAGTGNDSLVDTPTPYGTDTGAGGEVRGNYCTWNPLDNAGTLANGNLDFSNSGSNNKAVRSTFALTTTEKFYAEFTVTTSSSGSSGIAFGFAKPTATLTNNPANTGQYGLYADSSGYLFSESTFVSSSLGTFSSGTVLQMAYDGATGKAWVGKNNTWYNSSGGTTGNPSAGSNPTFTFTAGQQIFLYSLCYASTGTLNAGQRPFAYTAPSGFKALVTQNLPTPTVIQGDDYFNTVLYTGNGSGSNRAITGYDFAPGLIWLKSRSNALNHRLVNSIDGNTKTLASNLSTGEVDASTEFISLDSNGFTIKEGASFAFNTNNYTYVAWGWLSAGSNSTNTSGTITSTVRANTTAGFSVVTYTSPNSVSDQTVGHGLGVAPAMLFVKNKDDTANWDIYHQSLGYNASLTFTTAATRSGAFGSTINSTVFTTKDQYTQYSTNKFVAYCFAEIAGFSAFGKYTGNGSTDGPFIYTGFRPAFVMYKESSATNSWIVLDDKRNTYNGSTSAYLYPDLSLTEQNTTAGADFLSNGFKLRTTNSELNANTQTYIYAAFAENPFKYSLAR